MPIYQIPKDHIFPDPRLAEPNGMLGIGGDLHPDRIWLAYQYGIFPWFSDNQPICWWSPDPRMVLYPDNLRVGRSLGKRIRQQRYSITMDRAFEDVIEQCSAVPRADQDGTWITDEMKQAYVHLHHQGRAHSVEAWQDGQLVGGFYGISIGRVFAGESMFARAPDASKIAFATFVTQFKRWGGTCVDCQMHTPHLERFGAVLVDRSTYLDELTRERDRRIAPDRWSFDEDFVYDGR